MSDSKSSGNASASQRTYKFEDQTKNIEKVIEGNISPQPAVWQDIDAEFNLNAMGLREFAEIDYAAMEAKCIEKNIVIPFTFDEYYAYLRTFAYSRIMWTSYGSGYVVHPMDRIIVPSFINVLLSNIGICTNNIYGLTIKPKVSKDSLVDGYEWKDKRTIEDSILMFGLLSKDDMLKMSNYLNVIPGLSKAYGYLKDKTGIFDFMTMMCEVVGNEVTIYSYTPDIHPVYAFLASVLESNFRCSVLAKAIEYGHLTHLKSLYWKVVSV